MKMRKILALLMAVSMCFALLTACGDKTPAATTDPATTTEGADDALANAKAVELVMQCHDPESSICGSYLQDWEAMVTEASAGKITFVNYFGGSLVSSAESVDAVQNGVADMCWSAATIYSGQFPISEFIQLPLAGITCARMGCKVFTQMLAEIPELQTEYSNYQVVQVSACTTAPLSFTAKQPQTLADFQGLRMRVAGSTASLWATAVGISPMTVATPETYESLEKNVIEGCANDWHNIMAFSLQDVVNYVMTYECPGSPMFVLMNKDSYGNMDPALQAIIDEYSGSYASDMAGYYWDSTRSAAIQTLKDAGAEVYDCPDDVRAAFTSDSVKTEVHAAYVEYLNGYKLDGQTIYDSAMAIVAQYADEYADPWGAGCPNAESTDTGFQVTGWTALADYKG